MSKWSVEIVSDLEKVNKGEIELKSFVNKHWERFKPVYINFHGCCEDEADLYLLVYKFFNRIIRSDVQPLFQSDNQIFSYFKSAVRNKHYDDTHKKEIKTISFSEWYELLEENTSKDPIEDKIPANDMLVEDKVNSEHYVEHIFEEISKMLSEPYIKLMVLLYKGYTPKEARKELGVSLTTVRDRIGVLRETLRDIIKIDDAK